MKDEILRRDRAAGGIGNGTCGNRPAAGGTGHRIAVISDTHNLLRPEVVEIIKTCDAVLHGGDISGPETLEKIRRACGTAASYRIGGGGNFYAVRGNNDRDWAADIPYELEVQLYGRKFYMTHKKKDIPADVDADVVIYGHSHKYAQTYVDGILYLNPGSCGPRRFYQDITMAVMELDEASGQYKVFRIDIPHEAKKGFTRDNIQTGDIEKVIRLAKSGRTVSEIAASLEIERDLAEQICRLYLTHPGVSAEGIMSKMGL